MVQLRAFFSTDFFLCETPLKQKMTFPLKSQYIAENATFKSHVKYLKQSNFQSDYFCTAGGIFLEVNRIGTEFFRRIFLSKFFFVETEPQAACVTDFGNEL